MLGAAVLRPKRLRPTAVRCIRDPRLRVGQHADTLYHAPLTSQTPDPSSANLHSSPPPTGLCTEQIPIRSNTLETSLTMAYPASSCTRPPLATELSSVSLHSRLAA